MKIFLVGLPGCGKTTLGRQLARRLNVSFVDLDAAIEKRENMLIKDIFKEKKEPYFREVESTVLKGWCDTDVDFVMATGGGAPCFFDNMDNMNKAGKTVFLDVPAREIAHRIMRSNVEERPLLAGNGIDGLKDQIEFLRTQRKPFYKKAHHIFKGGEISVDLIIQQI